MTDTNVANAAIAQDSDVIPTNPTDSKPTGSETRTPAAAKDKKKPAKPATEAKRQTKASQVEAMLARKSGATLDQMCEATGWQSHTCRAFMTGLRKKGRDVTRETGKSGKSVYRFGTAKADAKAN